MILIGHINNFLGVNLSDSLRIVIEPFNKILIPVNMLAIGMFFAALGWKSGTLTNPDSRRRLRLIVIGTAIAMTPSRC